MNTRCEMCNDLALRFTVRANSREPIDAYLCKDCAAIVKRQANVISVTERKGGEC